MALTDTVRKLLDTIDLLPEAERYEVFREILQRATLSEHTSPTDDDLVTVADEVFLSLDDAEKEE